MTDRRDVERAFTRLTELSASRSIAAGSYLVERPHGVANMFLAHSAEGVDSLILATVAGSPVPPLRLTGLSVDYGVDCELIEGEQIHQIRASVVRSSADPLASGDLFATLCASLIDGMPTPTSDHDLAHEVDRWARLFWRITQPATVEIVGLAGELVCIAESSDPVHWVRAWHARPEDRLDFSFLPGATTVEVKTTSRDRRLHDLSLAQVAEDGLLQRFFVSVRVVEGDHTLGGLVQDLVDRLDDNDARLAFWNVLSLTCGSGLDAALAYRINYELARTSLRFYRAQDIPRPTVQLPLPNGVSKVRFTSDFEVADGVDAAHVDSAIH